MKGYVLVVVVLVMLAVPVYGLMHNWLLREDGWKVIAEPSIVKVHPRSTDVEHLSEAVVELRNITRDDVRVVGVQSSCSCISPIEQFPFVLTPTDKKQIKFRLHCDETVKHDDTLGEVSFVIDAPSPPVKVAFQADLKGSD